MTKKPQANKKELVSELEEILLKHDVLSDREKRILNAANLEHPIETLSGAKTTIESVDGEPGECVELGGFKDLNAGKSLKRTPNDAPDKWVASEEPQQRLGQPMVVDETSGMDIKQRFMQLSEGLDRESAEANYQKGRADAYEYVANLFINELLINKGN